MVNISIIDEENYCFVVTAKYVLPIFYSVDFNVGKILMNPLQIDVPVLPIIPIKLVRVVFNLQ